MRGKVQKMMKVQGMEKIQGMVKVHPRGVTPATVGIDDEEEDLNKESNCYRDKASEESEFYERRPQDVSAYEHVSSTFGGYTEAGEGVNENVNGVTSAMFSGFPSPDRRDTSKYEYRKA